MRSGMKFLSAPREDRLLCRMLCMLALSVACWPLAAWAQSGVPSNYPQFEAQRRDAIARQLGTQEQLRARSGFSSRLYPGLQPYSLEAIYSGLATPAGAFSWGSPDVFEPWPLAPGDLYGRQYDFGVQTPLGHVTTYTSPNSYVYEPYYAAPLADRPPPRKLPHAIPWRAPEATLPAVPPWLPQGHPSARGSRTAPPGVEEIPPPPAETLREF